MKISVFTTILPDLTPEEAAVALRNAGYDGAEWRVTRIPDERRNEAPSFWGNNLCTFEPTLEDAARARQLSEANGLEIPHLGSYISVGDLGAVEKNIAFAKRVGTNRIRVGVSRLDASTSYRKAFGETRDFLRRAADLAGQHNIKLLIETHHGTVIPSASATYRLVEDFNPDQLGVIYDPGNMAQEGYESYRLGIELLGPYLAHVHIKNAKWLRTEEDGVWRAVWSPMEDGVIDFRALFTALQEAGYDGWLGMEDFSTVRPTRDGLRHNIQFVRAMLSEVTI